MMAETIAAMSILGTLYGAVLWLVFACGCAWIAETKGHGQVWWLLLGLVFGPPVILIIGLSDGKPLPPTEGK